MGCIWSGLSGHGTHTASSVFNLEQRLFIFHLVCALVLKKDFSFVSPHFPAAVFFCLSPPTLSRAPQPGGFHLKISSFKSQFPLFSVKYDSQRKTLSAVNHRRTCSFNLKFSLSNFPSLLSPVVSSSRETNSGLVSRCDVAGSSPSSLLTCWRGTDGILQKSVKNLSQMSNVVHLL